VCVTVVDTLSSFLLRAGYEFMFDLVWFTSVHEFSVWFTSGVMTGALSSVVVDTVGVWSG